MLLIASASGNFDVALMRGPVSGLSGDCFSIGGSGTILGMNIGGEANLGKTSGGTFSLGYGPAVYGFEGHRFEEKAIFIPQTQVIEFLNGNTRTNKAIKEVYENYGQY